MTRRHYALQIEELQGENEYLREQIEELQERLSFYEEEDESSTQSQTQRSEWSDWPYCWFVASWCKITECFHSFHAKLRDGLLARHNVLSRRRFWRRPSRNHIELKML